jgi:signal transduction histidine kinase/CheY-like chemotaxis protein
MKPFKKLFLICTGKQATPAVIESSATIDKLFPVHEIQTTHETDLDLLEATTPLMGMWNYSAGRIVIDHDMQSMMGRQGSLSMTLDDFLTTISFPEQVRAELQESLQRQVGGLNTLINTTDGRNLRIIGKVPSSSTINGCAVDITKHVQLEEQNKQIEILTALHESDQQQKQYMHNLVRTVCHEIRNPLQGIISNFENIEHQSSDPEIRRCVRNGLASSWFQLDVLNELINLQGLDEMESELNQHFINDLIVSSLNMFINQCQRKDISIKLFASCTISAKFHIKNVRRIITNFISNAVKFTNSGHIHIHLASTDTSCTISVADTGPGIPQHMRKSIFVRDIQQRETTNIFNTGLGLHICHEMAKVISATVGFNDNVPVGSVFWVTFPVWDSVESERTEAHRSILRSEALQNASSTGNLQLREDNGSGSSSGSSIMVDREHNYHSGSDRERLPSFIPPANSLNVLIADDNVVIARAFCLLLTKQGHTCRTVHSGAGAIAEIERNKQKPFDLLLCDLLMPKVTGVDVLKYLRASDLTAHTTCIFATGDVESSVADMLHKLNGASAPQLHILIKPIRKHVLLNVVHSISVHYAN